MAVESLPLAVRAWAATRHARFRGRARIGTSLVHWRAVSGVTYRTPEGLALSIDTDDYFQACMLLGIYEPATGRLIRRSVPSDSVVFDIGHHIGYFTLKLAHVVGRGGEVHAFDPDPRAHDRLLAHVVENQTPWVTVNRLAASNAVGIVQLRLPTQLGWASTKPVVQAETTIDVPAVTVDKYVDNRGIDPARIRFIKVDVESAELEALQGMQKTLRESNPIVVVEVVGNRQEQRASEIFAFMDALGYRPSREQSNVVFSRRA
jgi:FkbM family methyltransferase